MTELADVIAERQLVAAALSGATTELLSVPVDAFTAWQAKQIAVVIHDLHARRIPVDPPVVLREVVARSATDEHGRQLGKLVTDLTTQFVPATSAAYYAERITAMHTARTAVSAAETFRNAVEWGTTNDDEQALTDATRQMRQALDDADVAFRPAAPEPPMSLHDLLTADDEPYDWLVPGLLERGDRAIITGFEGLGKSYLLAQFALCIGAGVHPFTTVPLDHEPRVLIFDVENSRRQLQRRYRRISRQVEDIRNANGMPPVDWSQCVRIVSRPEGVSLTEPRELARIEQSITASAPDLVLAGPIYKMSKLDIRDEQAAKELLDTLDLLRVRHQFTLIAEAHAGHSSDSSGSRRVRPIGSSALLRWPEFGFGIAPNEAAAHMEHPNIVDVRHWRGGRDDRRWPRQLKHGDTLPWMPANRDYWDHAAAAA